MCSSDLINAEDIDKQLKAEHWLYGNKSNTCELRKSGKSRQGRPKREETIRHIHEERLKVLTAVNSDYEEAEFTAKELFSTSLDYHVDRSEGYLRVIHRKRAHVHFDL